MKKMVIFLILVLSVLFCIHGQDSLLGQATSYYDKDDYGNAKNIYLEILKTGKFSGETLYRYAYSNEMLKGINSDVLDLYAASYYYLLIDDSNNQYLENSKNKLELNSYDINLITIGKTEEIIKYTIKTNTIVNSPLRIFSKSLNFLGQSDSIFVLFIIALIIYAIALLFSSKTGCVIIWGWWDLILLAIPGLIFVYYLFNVDNIMKYDETLNIIFFITSIATFALSVIINIKYSGIKGLLFAIVSVLAKIVIMILIPIIIFLFFMALSSGKKDRRYRDGTKGNTKTMWLAIVGAIALFLVINLIKTEQES
ncbi:MAG: hypothetical protein LBQ93_03880 [Treponema sp.]|jgi:hypothetical protein|nr:hypothetical protein [Treponema sp.]